jgi:BASS family bile acid:Na+ symporter
VGTLFRMDTTRRRTLSIEIGMQNAGLGTVLALEHFGAGATIPTAAFVFVCILTASLAASVWQKHAAMTLSATE